MGKGKQVAGLGLMVVLLGMPAVTGLGVRPGQAQATDPRKEEADRLLQQGIQQYQISQFTAALQSWEQALALYRQLKDRQGEGNALGNLGNAYYALGNYPRAIDYHEQYLAIAREIKNRQGEGNALGSLGLAYQSLGNYPRAIEYLEQTLAILREIKDRRGEGAALGNLGIAYQALGNYSRAIEYLEQTLAILREIKDRRGEGAALGNLGLAYYSLGNYPQAIEYHEQYLAIAREIKDRRGEGAALGNLGLAYYSLGNYPRAIEYHEQSLAIAREIKDRRGEGNALGNLGIAYHSLGNYPRAINYHEQRLAIAREIKDRRGEGNALGNLGAAYQALGNYPRAIDYLEQRLAIAREIKDRRGEGTGLNNLGLAYLNSGKAAAAEAPLYAAIQVWESLRPGLTDAQKVSIFETQATSYWLLQKSLIAQGKVEQALEVAERGRARAFVELLASRQAAGGSPRSQALPGRGLSEALPRQTLVAGSGLKTDVTDGKSAKPREGLRSLDFPKNRGSGQAANHPSPRSQALPGGGLSEALPPQASLEAGASRRGFPGRTWEPDNPQMTNDKGPMTKGDNPTVKPLTINDIKQIAKDQNATLVQYSIIGNEALYIWVVKPNGQVSFAQTNLKDLKGEDGRSGLATLIDQSRAEDLNARGRSLTFIENPEYARQAAAQIPDQVADHRHLKQLHELLVAPIAQHLPPDPNQRVIFMPQGELFFVPFPALKTANDQFLIEKHTITTAPAIQVLQLTRQQRQKLGNREQETDP